MYKIILIKTFEGLRSEVGHLIKLRISPGKQTKTEKIKCVSEQEERLKKYKFLSIFLLRVNLNEIGQIQFFFLFYNNPLCF